MANNYQLIFTIVGVVVVAVAVVMAWRNKGESVFSMEAFAVRFEVSGAGMAVAAVGLCAMLLPWFVPAPVAILDAVDHPISAFQICVAPDGEYVVSDNLPDGPLNVRLGAGTQYQEINALRSGTGGLRFDQCVQRHSGATQWWRVDGSGWLFSRYVERQ